MISPLVSKGISVPYVDLGRQHEVLKPELLAAVDRVMSHGKFILDEEVAAFESEFAAYCGTRFAVGVGNGTDAIILALKALGIGLGDEVITVPNSFLASASAIVLAGARPVFVDVREDYNLDPDLLEAAITPRTRAILPVHLGGRPADMFAILETARSHGLAVVEDAAQAVGARYQSQRVGSIGIAGCFSLHPLKNLNACGDGGVVTTNDEAVYTYLMKARNHGLRTRDLCEFWSLNSRLDALHAAMLRVKLKYLDHWTDARRANAAFYRKCLADVSQVPDEKQHEFAVYHSFVIQADRRDELIKFLHTHGVEAKVHYPIPIHLQESAASLEYCAGQFPVAERLAQRIVSLPVYPELTPHQREHVVDCIRAFYLGSHQP